MALNEQLTKHPWTGEYEQAEWVANHFGPGKTGVWFADGSIYNPAQIPLKTKYPV